MKKLLLILLFPLSLSAQVSSTGQVFTTFPLTNTVGTNSIFFFATQGSNASHYVTRTIQATNLLSWGVTNYGAIGHVSNIAAMQALNPTNYPAVIVDGYWEPNDGGGGIYFRTNTITGTNFGSRVISTSVTSSWSWDLLNNGLLNAKQFGAKFDGVTDDTVRIQSTINAGRGVEFPPNQTAIVSRPNGAIACLTNYSGNLIINGNGSTIKLANGSYTTNSTIMLLFQGVSITDKIRNITVRDLILDGNNLNQGNVDITALAPYNGLQLTYVEDVTIENVVAKNQCHDGIATGASRDIRWLLCKAFANGKNGLYAANETTNVTITSCTTYSNNYNFGYGAYLSGIEYSGIFFGSDGGGITLSKADHNGRGITMGFTGATPDIGVDISCNGNQVIGNAAQGIYVINNSTSPANSRRIAINGNVVRNSGNSGITSYGSMGLSIVGNVVFNNTIGGIIIAGTDATTTISGNTIFGTTASGVYVRATTNVTIVANSFDSIGAYALEIAASGGLGTNSNLYLTFKGNSVKTATLGIISGYNVNSGMSHVDYYTGALLATSGNGTPEGVIAAPVGSTYHNLTGGAGTSFYIKESSPTPTTGWVGK